MGLFRQTLEFLEPPPTPFSQTTTMFQIYVLMNFGLFVISDVLFLPFQIYVSLDLGVFPFFRFSFCGIFFYDVLYNFSISVIFCKFYKFRCTLCNIYFYEH